VLLLRKLAQRKLTIRLLDILGVRRPRAQTPIYVHDFMGHASPHHIRGDTGSPDLLGMRPQASSLVARNLAGVPREGDAVATLKSAVNQDYYMRN
jgi:hypothetical protein